LLQKRIGTSRNVIVQPSTYGVFNDGLVEALGECGPTARGVAVVDTGVTDAELKRLDAAHVRGIRFNLATGGATTVEMLEPLAKRIAPMGWHIQMNAGADIIVANKDLLNRLVCEIVFDHLAHVPEPVGVAHPVFGVVVDLLQKGRAWVKLSGACRHQGRPADLCGQHRGGPGLCEGGARAPGVGQRLAASLGKGRPQAGALLFDLLAQWAPDEAVRNRILVDNPAKVYGFS
jgi:D-galactarolactone isomerase